MNTENTLHLLVEAATVALALEKSPEQQDYAAIWNQVRRVIVRFSVTWAKGEDINDEVLLLAKALTNHGNMA